MGLVGKIVRGMAVVGEEGIGGVGKMRDAARSLEVLSMGQRSYSQTTYFDTIDP